MLSQSELVRISDMGFREECLEKMFLAVSRP